MDARSWRRPIAFLRDLSGNPWARAALFVTLAVVANAVWLWRAGSMDDYRDAQYFTLFEDSARKTVAEYHQFPFWNPYYCGGVYALGTPSARFSSPTLLLSILFGTLRANPLIAILLCVIGLEGTYRYARAQNAGTLGALAAAPVFALCGFFPRSGAFDWVNFFGFELLPWAALGLRHAFQDESPARATRGAVLAGATVGFMTCFGGTYAAPYTLLVGAWELAEGVVRHRRDRAWLLRIVQLGAIAALLAAGIACVRVWPIAETLASSPRVLGATDANSPIAIIKMLFGSRIPFRGEFLVGVLVLPFALIAAIERRGIWLLAMACFFLWLASGYAATPSGFAILRTIPPYTMLRSPERFLVPFSLAYATLVARGLGRFEIFARRRKWKRGHAIVAIAVALVCIDDGVLVDNDWAWQRGRTLAASPVREEPREFAQARGDRWLAAYYPGIDRGTLSCFDDYPIPQSAALRGDLPHEEFLDDARAGTVERRAWSPNAITLHVETTKDARVVVNQNWHPGWRASVGTVVADHDRLAIDLPAGTHDVVLRFLPRSGVFGLATSIAALLACIALVRVRRVSSGTPRMRWVALGIAALPLTCVAMGYAFTSEPKRPPHALLLPDGEPIVRTDPPPNSQHIGARFDEGITLEASHVALRRTPDGPMLDFELDWKLASPAPPGLGIFVHFEPDKGDTVNVDHVALATVAPFEAFPANMTLRDVLPGIAVEGGKTYKIYVGVWRARRNGSRLKVVDKGAATVDEDRILVATIPVP
jgi:hypothetical protein